MSMKCDSPNEINRARKRERQTPKSAPIFLVIENPFVAQSIYFDLNIFTTNVCPISVVVVQ